MSLIFWDRQGMIMIDYLEQGRTINGAYYAGHWSGYARKLQERDEAIWLMVFCSCRITALSISHKLPWLLRLNVYLKSFLNLHILLIWLIVTLSVPKTEIPSSWYTIWTQRRRKRVLGGPDNAFYLEVIRQLEQRWVKCIVLKGDYLANNGQICIPW